MGSRENAFKKAVGKEGLSARSGGGFKIPAMVSFPVRRFRKAVEAKIIAL
jgi:hypothetical protein